MINKQSLWFVTLLSLVMVLGIYYVTLPNDLLKTTSQTESKSSEVEVNVTESDMLVALRVERDEEISTVMKELETVLTSASATTEEKNNAFEELKVLNLVVGKESELEEKLKSEFNINSFVEVEKNQIKVVVSESKHDASLANKIMRSIQEEYTEKMYITVKFENS